MIRPANAEKNRTASVAWVDMVFSATIRSDTVGPAASRAISSAAIANSAIATARQISVIGRLRSARGILSWAERRQQVLHWPVDGLPPPVEAALGDLNRVILKLRPAAIEVDELVVNDERGDQPHGGETAGRPL